VSILVLGGSGLVGRALTDLLTKQKRAFLKPSSQELNLLNSCSVHDFFSSNRIDTVFFAAARVGGVGANVNHPWPFIFENLEIQMNVFRAALQMKVGRLIFLSSSAVYPEHSPLPHREESILSGPFSSSVRPYAMAKVTAMELIKWVNLQHKLQWISVIPSNVYGINDNFRIHESHVVAATIRKIWEAKSAGRDFIEVWGNPSNERDFIFANDLAEILLTLEEKYFDHEPINVGPGIGTTIDRLTKVVSKVMNFQGDVFWNSNKPSGTSRKYLDNSKIRNLGIDNFTSLEVGVSLVNDWLKSESVDAFGKIRWK
jgi:GDP-L-fucose synthase